MQRQSATSPDEPLRRLIGRDPDLQRVRGFIRDASVHGGSLIVRGDAGVGKTSLLAAARSGATTAFDTGGAKEHRLEQLTADNAARLFDARYPHVATIARARVLEQAAGNPFALPELGRSLTAMPRAGSDLPARLPLPARIRQFYEPRVAELSSGVRDLLLLAALYDGHDLRAVVAAASGDTGLGEILAGAVRLELVAVDQPDGPLSFRHPLARNAVVEMSTAADRRRAHARLATILD